REHSRAAPSGHRGFSEDLPRLRLANWSQGLLICRASSVARSLPVRCTGLFRPTPCLRVTRMRLFAVFDKGIISMHSCATHLVSWFIPSVDKLRVHPVWLAR